MWSGSGQRAVSSNLSEEGLAESFRSDLVGAARRCEAFDREQGLPVSMLRNEAEMPWFGFACQYVDMKWAIRGRDPALA